MSFDPVAFDVIAGLLRWLTVFGLCLGIVLVVSIVLSFFIGGGGPPAVFRQVKEGLIDLLNISLRRTTALTQLTIREALRRKTLLVLVVFAILFMFAGWFIQEEQARPEHQVRNLVSFVLTAISWLILPIVLMLACWGLPEEIKSRALHTVVTKPARRLEIVLGRILGFVGVGTFVLGVMAVVGYFWIVRQVPENARSSLIARVPIYGELNFLDREGNLSKDALNVGDIWQFRDFIEGATNAAAIWEFNNLDTSRLGDALTVETSFESFRSHKGVMGQGLLARMWLINPETGLRVPLRSFQSEEFRGENLHEIQRSQTYYDDDERKQKKADLFDDLIQDGKLRIEVQCLSAGQYLGMARPDLFIRAANKPFGASFFKAIGGIWLMSVLIIVLGVTASCFLKGPVAALLTFTLIIVGYGFRDFMQGLITGEQVGGGPFESIIRIYTHMNQTTKMPDTLTTDIVKTIDRGLIELMWLVDQAIPDFGIFSMSAYPANGFDVSWSAALLPSIAVTLAYIFPCVLIGYYTLKLRELETK